MKNINYIYNARFLMLVLFLFSFSSLSAQTIDSDGDGIVDQLDLDDDNDGVPDAAECSVTPVIMIAWQNIANTFAPDYLNPTFNTYIAGQNSTAGSGLTRIWTNGHQQLSQIVATTEAQAITNNEYVEYRITTGSRYIALNQVSYYINPTNISTTNYSYSLMMSGDNFATNTVLHGIQNYNAATSGGTFNVVNTVQTMFLNPNSTYVFRVYFYAVAGGNAGVIAHDDFALRGNFECDNDNDGTPNRLDLDSDNDGCWDAIEGDENVLLNQLTVAGRINISTTGGVGTTAGTNNGVPNLVNPSGTADVGGDIGQGLGDSQNGLVNSQCIDTDGDGIQNDFDLDDDNDGILDTVEDACEFEGTPIYNNNFGTGVATGTDANVVSHTYQAQTPSDGQYTVTTSNAQTAAHCRTELNGNIDAGNPDIASGSTDGRYLMINVNSGPTLNQAIYRVNNLSVLSGNRYRFRIDMAGLSGPGTAVPNLQLSIKDTSGNILATANSGNIGLVNDDVWRRLSLNFIATTSTVVLEIVNLQANGGGNDLGIDNVILAPLNICDVDGDGIPNSQDLDSDNDGCTDAIEGGTNFTTANLVTASGATLASQNPNQNLGNTVNTAAATLGIPTIAGIGQSMGQSQDWTKNDCLDSDGDGIPNWQDLDDDNDGIPDTVEDACATEGTPVYINNFGTGARTSDSNVLLHTYVASGNIPDGSYSVTRSLDGFSTFSQTERTGNLDAGNPVITGGSTDGKYLMINMSGLASMNQAIYRVSNLPTIVGRRYRFRIDMAGLSDGAIPIVKLVLKDTGGNTLATSNSINIGVNDDVWRRLTLDFVATTTNVTLEIVNLQSANGGNDLGIDNIILTPINICDNDGDGIPNSQDLDSDGDGCPDAIEGGGSFTNSNLVAATGAISTQTPNLNLGNTVGSGATTIGIPTIAGTGQSLGQSQDATKNDCVDSDGDGIPDWQDLDDDNDGILDTVECSPVNIFANFSSATITGGNTNSATVSGIGFGGITGTLTRVNNGTAVVSPLSVSNTDLSNATVFTPAGSTTQAALSEALQGYKGTTNYTRYTLTLDKPVESITLHFASFDYMRTRFVGAHGELLLSAGTETVYNGRQLYDSAPNTVLDVTRDGFGSIKITNRNGLPLSQIIFEKFDDPNSNSSFTSDGFGYTFSIQSACDTDGDGIPDRLDLDSDGDGCSDAIEGGANFTASNLVTSAMPGGNSGVNYNGLSTAPVVQNLGNTVGTTTTTMGVPTIAGTGQSVGQSQNGSRNDCQDSDGDGIPDWQDLDDDNDGILDTVECPTTATDFLNAFVAGGIVTNIIPSDFGLALNAKNQNVTKDISAKFGYPANSGAVIVSITNASVHPTDDVWWTKNGEQPSIWKVTGTMSAFVGMAHDLQYYANDSKTMHIYDNANVIPVTAAGMANQTAVAGQWSVTETQSQKTLTNLNTNNGTIESANWRYVNMNFGPKSFGFSTTVASANPNYAVVMLLECDTDKDGIPDRLDLDSDGDGCSDAIEGGADISVTQLVTAGGTLSGGSTTVNQNLCNGTTCVNTNGIPQFTTVPTNYSNTTGQAIGSSQNNLVNNCYCYKTPATVAGNPVPVRHGITALNRAGSGTAEWPTVRQSAWTVLESKTKGFVVNRLTGAQISAITSPVEGMMVYDVDANCLKIYNGTVWNCFTTQTCPD